MFAWLIHTSNHSKDKNEGAFKHDSKTKALNPLPPSVIMFTNKFNYDEILPLSHKQSIVVFR